MIILDPNTPNPVDDQNQGQSMPQVSDPVQPVVDPAPQVNPDPAEPVSIPEPDMPVTPEPQAPVEMPTPDMSVPQPVQPVDQPAPEGDDTGTPGGTPPAPVI